MAKTAIVILNWNGMELLKQFLPPLIQYSSTPDVEIIIADNGSDDASLDFLKKEYPHLQCIELSENYGFAEGYNKALAKIDAEYFILLNSDVEVTPNWLNPILSCFENNQDIVAVQPKILSQRNKEYFEYAGAAGGFIDKYGYPFCRGRIFSHVEKDHHQYDTLKEIFWASGACLAIRSNDFFEAGGFDASFFAHMEEIDLCWRINARGKKIVCLTASVVYHVGAATLKKENPRKTYLNFRNNLLMLYKNLPQKKLKRVMTIRLMLDYLAALEFSVTGKFANAKEVIRAHKDFYNNRSEYTRLRKENLDNTANEAITTIYPKSILFTYFIKRKRIFSKLPFYN